MITPNTTRVKKGDDKTFEIQVYEGYRIVDVLIDGESVGAVKSYTFENVKKQHTIEAIFEKLEIVEKVFSFDTEGRDNTQKGIYQIKHPYVHFYYRYLFPNQTKIMFWETDEFYDQFDAMLKEHPEMFEGLF